MNCQEIDKERLKYLAYYKKRIRYSKILIITSLIGFVLTTILSFVTVFFKVYYRFGFLMFIFFIMFSVGLFIPFRVEKIAKLFSTTYKKPLIELIINKYYDNAKYESETDLKGVIKRSVLINGPIDKAKAEDIITGEYKGVYFKSFDVEVQQINEYLKNDPRRSPNSHYSSYFNKLSSSKSDDVPDDFYGHIFKGIWFNFELKRRFYSTIWIKEAKYGGPDPELNLKEVDVESTEFSNKYKAYTSNKQLFFYIFTPAMIEKFMQLDRICDGQIMFSLKGNEINIGINNNEDTLELSLFTPVTKEALKPLEEQIKLTAAIINSFNLSSDKFQKEQK